MPPPKSDTGSPEYLMPEVVAEAAPKKKRGRPAKVRHDAPDAPVDGDYARDRVYGKEPGKRYYWTSDEDAPVIHQRGGDIVRHGDGPRAAFANVGKDSKPGEPIRVGSLTLMSVSEENAARAELPGRAIAAQRMKGLRREALKSTPRARVFEDDGYGPGYSRTRE